MGAIDTKSMSGSCALVTGGAGFIGSNLCERLLSIDCTVVCLDNFSTGHWENIAHLLSNPDFTLIVGDVSEYETCQKAAEGVEFVFHQAAWGSVPRSIEMPLFYEKMNIQGVLNMMEASRNNQVKRFVYASSSSVYGDEPTLPKVEGREGKLLSPYALTKAVGELYGSLYYRIYGLETVGLRYFNVFGRHQDPDGTYAAVIPRFIKELLSGGVPTIQGDGLQSRDFTYIDNVVQGNLCAATAPVEAAGRAYNIACGGQETLIDVYYMICKALGVNQEPQYAPTRAGDIKHSNADISQAREMLGYKPEFSFEQGLELAIEWYREELS